MKTRYKNSIYKRHTGYNNRNIKDKSSSKYGEKFLTRLCVCALICAIVFGVSKLENEAVNNFMLRLKYAVMENIDFNEAKTVFENIYDKALEKGKEIYNEKTNIEENSSVNEI